MLQSNSTRHLKTIALAFILLAALAAPGAEKLFSDSIRPVFEKSCLPCHGPQTKSAGLDLSTRDGLLRGGAQGPAVVSGDPKASLLYKLVAQEAEPHMPYKSAALPKEAIDRIAEWIAAGGAHEEKAGAGGAPFPGQVLPCARRVGRGQRQFARWGIQGAAAPAGARSKDPRVGPEPDCRFCRSRA